MFSDVNQLLNNSTFLFITSDEQLSKKAQTTEEWIQFHMLKEC